LRRYRAKTNSHWIAPRDDDLVVGLDDDPARYFVLVGTEVRGHEAALAKG
jgi:hypothetical protein